MLEFKLNIDISDKFENAIKTLADAIVIHEKLQHEYMQEQERMSFDEAPENSHQDAPESKETAKPTEVQPEPEKAQEAPKESKSEGIPAEVKAEEAPEPTADPLAPAEDAKPQKKARVKAPKKAPERVEEPKPAEVQPEPEKAPECVEEPQPTEVQPEPEKAQEAPKESKSEGDPMQGMNLMQAVKAITDELRERGVEMADANARVRRRTNDLGLSYSSFTCLVKAIGYTEARRVALGE